MKIAIVCQVLLPDEPYIAYGYPIKSARRLVYDLTDLGNIVALISASLPPPLFLKRLNAFHPDLIVNLAEGLTRTGSRQALFPELYESLGYAYLGPNGHTLTLTLDKYTTKSLVHALGYVIPQGNLYRRMEKEIITIGAWKPRFPAIVKPNFGSDSQGITAGSVVHSNRQLQKKLREMLEQYPEGVLVEEFILGKEVKVNCFLEETLLPVEMTFNKSYPNPYNIEDYNLKNYTISPETIGFIRTKKFSSSSKIIRAIERQSEVIFRAFGITDFGRIDYRITPDNDIFFLELTPLVTFLQEGDLFYALSITKGILYRESLRRLIYYGAKKSGHPYYVQKKHTNVVSKLLSRYYWQRLHNRILYGT